MATSVTRCKILQNSPVMEQNFTSMALTLHQLANVILCCIGFHHI